MLWHQGASFSEFIKNRMSNTDIDASPPVTLTFILKIKSLKMLKF